MAKLLDQRGQELRQAGSQATRRSTSYSRLVSIRKGHLRGHRADLPPRKGSVPVPRHQ